MAIHEKRYDVILTNPFAVAKEVADKVRQMLRAMRLTDIGTCVFTLIRGGEITVIVSFDSVQRGVSLIPTLKIEVMYDDLIGGDLIYHENTSEDLGSQRDPYEGNLDYVRETVESILNSLN